MKKSLIILFINDCLHNSTEAIFSQNEKKIAILSTIIYILFTRSNFFENLDKSDAENDYGKESDGSIKIGL